MGVTGSAWNTTASSLATHIMISHGTYTDGDMPDPVDSGDSGDSGEGEVVAEKPVYASFVFNLVVSLFL